MKRILFFLIALLPILFTSCEKEFVFDANTWDMAGSVWESKDDSDLKLAFDSNYAARCYFDGEACGFGTYKKSGLNITLELSALASYKVLRFDTATLSSDGSALTARVTTVSYPTDKIENHTFVKSRL